VGTIGDVGIFSINESKHISAGEGGIVITNDEAVGRYADLFVDKSYNRSGKGPVDPVMPALNYRLSEINAVVAIEQLKRVREITRRRHQLGEMLARGIEGLPGIRLVRPPAHSKCTYWGAVFIVDPELVGIDGIGFAKALSAEGIRAGAPAMRMVLTWPLFQKLNENPKTFPTYYAPGLRKGQFGPSRCPNAVALLQRSVRVHLDEFCTARDVRDTVRGIRKVARWYAAGAK
jgi:dTDP-4-amino-4,6-dideoxygalactose transaminase